MARDKAGFALESDCVCHQTTAGGKLRPASVEEVIVADASSEEDRIWRQQACKGGWRSPLDDLQVWYTEPRGIFQDSSCTVCSRFEGDAGARGVKTHPLDPNRSSTRAYVPEGLVWKRSESCQRNGAHLALGQLAIGIKGVVGQTWRDR
jgi:hypothetical protein